MLKLYIQAQDAIDSFRRNESGVVSFEYVIVAACIVGAVSLAFGNNATSGIGLVLANSITEIGNAVKTAVAG